jgi:integrase
MRIQDFTEQYVAGRDLSRAYGYNLRKRAQRIADFTGSAELADVLTEEGVNRFLASLTDLTPVTVRSYRSDVLSLWNAAADLDLCGYPVMRRIRRPKCPRQVIECFTVDEVRAMLTFTGGMYGYPLSNGVDRGVYWNAIIRLAWDTGLRRGDCWAFRKSWIRDDGTARVVQRKTQQVVLVRLHRSTIDALDAIPHDAACDWPGKVSNAPRFCKQFKALVRKAGVSRGTFKWLRRSSGSYVDLAQPGSGSKHLGHSSSQVFGQHYDAKLGGKGGPMPPELGEAEVAHEPAAMPTRPAAVAADPLDEFAFL